MRYKPDGSWRRPSANALVSAIFVEAWRAGIGHLWVSQLLTLAAAVDLDERSVRTSLHRLEQQGFLCALRFGRQSVYGLTAAATADHEQRYAGAAAPSWDGRWTVVTPLMRQPALAAQLHERGFRQLLPGLYAQPGSCLASFNGIVRPHGERLRTLAFETDRIAGMSQDELAAAVAAAWDLPTVCRQYDAFAATCGQELERYADPRQPPAPAHSFALRLRLMSDWRRACATDPRLPAALLPAAWPAMRAHRLCLRLDGLLDAGAAAFTSEVASAAAAAAYPSLPSIRARHK